MLILNLTAKMPKAVLNEDGQPVIEYDKETKTACVASSRGKNALLDDLKEVGFVPTETEVLEVEFGVAEIEKAIKPIVEDNVENKYVDRVVSYILDQLDKGCVLVRNDKK